MKTLGAPWKRVIPVSLVLWLFPVLLCWPADAQGPRTITFKVTSRMWDAEAKRQIATPQLIIDKIQKAFDLWSAVEESGLRFRYGGLVDADYKGFHEVPQDGAVYIVLNNWDIGQCADGLSQSWGEIPAHYEGGVCVINTKKGAHPISEEILVHEIGHALGIHRHAASPSDIMSQADHPWNIEEYLTLSEQDRADLIRVWRPESPNLFTISGRVVTSLPEQKTDDNFMAVVYAVSVDNGHAYSAKTDQDGRFSIALLRAGSYRVLAKPFEPYLYHKPASQSPSWYLADGQSTNDPYAGRVFNLDASHRTVGDIVIKIIDRPVAFNLYRAGITYGKDEPFCFLRPGIKTRLNIQGTGITALEAYGTHPDYQLSNVEIEPHFRQTTNATVEAGAGAEPGERLVIAKGRPGEAIQASLIGVNVVKEVPPLLSRGSLQELADQVHGKVPEKKKPYAGSGRMITYKPGDPLPPELAPRPARTSAVLTAAKAPGLLFSGMSRAYYPDGRLKLETNYMNGKLNGSFKSYFPTGELKAEGQYVDGRYDGILKTYFQAKAVRLEEKYENGQRIYLKEFDSSGRLLQESPPPQGQ